MAAAVPRVAASDSVTRAAPAAPRAAASREAAAHAASRAAAPHAPAAAAVCDSASHVLQRLVRHTALALAATFLLLLVQRQIMQLLLLVMPLVLLLHMLLPRVLSRAAAGGADARGAGKRSALPHLIADESLRRLAPPFNLTSQLLST